MGPTRSRLRQPRNVLRQSKIKVGLSQGMGGGKVPMVGIEPTIFCLGSKRLIHWATRATGTSKRRGHSKPSLSSLLISVVTGVTVEQKQRTLDRVGWCSVESSKSSFALTPSVNTCFHPIFLCSRSGNCTEDGNAWWGSSPATLQNTLLKSPLSSSSSPSSPSSNHPLLRHGLCVTSLFRRTLVVLRAATQVREKAGGQQE